MATSLPRVSVIIPTFNRAGPIRHAIESVRVQTLGEFELLVVDDGSTDETPEVLRTLAAEEPRMRVLSQENAGASAARNVGIDAARAPLVAFLDSDDLWEPDYLASQLAILEAHPGTDFVLCDARYVGDWGMSSETVFGDDGWSPPTNMEVMFEFGFALPSCSCVRTHVARSVRFDEDRYNVEDTDFLFRFLRSGHVLRVNPAVLTQYRRADASGATDQIVAHPLRNHLAHLDLFEEYIEHAPDPMRMRRRLARRRALAYARAGQWADARPFLAEWWRRHPRRTRALRLYLRSFVARSPAR